VSESRILVLDNDAVRAERTVALLEFMDFNPRWVSDAADFDLGRQRQNDWMAVIVGSLDDSAASTALYNWLGGSSLPPPVLLADGDAAAFAQQHGLHEANIWPLETPLRHAQMEALLRRASLKRLDAEHQAGAAQDQDRPAAARRSPRCAP
jgi:sigma-54 specific flagellar transcriptional regulator A